MLKEARLDPRFLPPSHPRRHCERRVIGGFAPPGGCVWSRVRGRARADAGEPSADFEMGETEEQRETETEKNQNIPVLRIAAGLIVALSAPLGGAENMRTRRRQPRQRVCETTCLDIVGLAGFGWGLARGGSGLVAPQMRAVVPLLLWCCGCVLKL